MAIDERELFEAVRLDMSPEFRRRLERDLRAAASAGVVPMNSPLGDASGTDGPSSRRRVWVTASAAALLIAATVGITAIRLHHRPSLDNTPKPTTAPTTVATTTVATTTTSTSAPPDTLPVQQANLPDRSHSPFGVVLDNIHAIDLDPWLVGAPPWSTTDRDGPYLIFDLNQLPNPWSAVSVEGSHPLSGPGYSWKAQLSSGSIEATLSVENTGLLLPADASPVTIRARNGHESTTNGQDTLTWMEEGLVQVRLSSSSPSAMPALLALAESLRQISVDSMGPQPAWPTPGGISFDVGSPELSGTIGGHLWTVDTGDESLARALYPRVDGVLLGGINIAADNPTPPGYTYGIATTAVIGGVMILAIVPSEIDHAVARLSDNSQIEVAGYQWPDRTGIVIPIPHGLDVTSVDFEKANGTSLKHIDIPEYPPVVSGGYISYSRPDQ